MPSSASSASSRLTSGPRPGTRSPDAFLANAGASGPRVHADALRTRGSHAEERGSERPRK